MEPTSQVRTLVSDGPHDLQCHAKPAGAEETYLVVNTLPGRPVSPSVNSAYQWIADQLAGAGMAMVQERIFAERAVSREVMDARRRALLEAGMDADGALTFIEGRPARGGGVAGILVRAVAPPAGSTFWDLRSRGEACGRGWKRHGATYLVLQNIHGRVMGPASINAPPAQISRMIERVEEVLNEQGATYAHVARTWFYLANILDWYDDFNRVRSKKYRSFGLMPGPGREDVLLPASTGIGGDNLHGAAAVMDLMAVIPDPASAVTVRQLSNPRQEDAVRYGSAFSRGARISSSHAGHVTIQVSGTAAIGRLGETLYPEDVRSQIACTLDTIEALLETQGAALADIAAATVFVKRPEDAAVFHRMAIRRGIEPFPGVTVVADICRSELLFEIDAEVVYNPRGNR